jgi:hypothetical protein
VSGGGGDPPRSPYEGYDVLEKWSSPDWDEATREVVRRRLEAIPPLRFFTADEVRLLDAIVERIVLQPERRGAERVAIVPWIDEKLFHDWRDGYRYEDVPPLREAWRLGLAAVDATAHRQHGRAFADLDVPSQDEVLQTIQRGDVPGELWSHVPADRFFRDVLCLTVVKVYYAHPAAWSEIGYSGPSSPRGHVRNWMGGVDPWDAPEAG